MDKILGYSVYFNKDQNLNYSKAYSIKSEVVENSQKHSQDYGTGLGTILIFYIFEAVPGEFNNYNFSTTISNFKKIDKSIRVTFYVRFREFKMKNTEEQLRFYHLTTLEALELVKEKLSKRKDIEIDFEGLILDVDKGFRGLSL